MAEAKDLKAAKLVYDTVCAVMTEEDWKFDKNEEDLTISTTLHGEDLPIDLTIRVDAERNLVSLYSMLPFHVPEDKRVDMSVAVSLVNNTLVDGSFDYNIMNGKTIFRMTSSFKESLLGKDLFQYMVYVSCKTVDDYNDKFLAYIKGRIELSDLIGD